MLTLSFWDIEICNKSEREATNPEFVTHFSGQILIKTRENENCLLWLRIVVTKRVRKW